MYTNHPASRHNIYSYRCNNSNILYSTLLAFFPNCTLGRCCPNGYESDGGHCIACPAGKFSAPGDYECTDCPLNSNSAPASPSPRSCRCNSGFVGSTNGVIAYPWDTCKTCAPGTYSHLSPELEIENRYTPEIHNRGSYDLHATCSSCPAFSNSSAQSGFAADCHCLAGYMCFSGGIPCKDRFANAFVAFSQRLCTTSLRQSLRRQALDSHSQVAVVDTSESNWTVSSSVTVCGGGGLGNATRYKAYSKVYNGATYGDDNFTCDEFLPGRYSPNHALGVCEDVNECALDVHSCKPQNVSANWTGPSETQVRCSNTLGSFECICAAGYEADVLGSDMLTEGGMPLECVDQDECAVSTHNCHRDATCTNTEGSYTCSCNRYFKGDGVVDCWDGQMECSPAISWRVKTASGDACWAKLSNLTSATGGPAVGSYCDDHAGTTGRVFLRIFWLDSQTWSEERQLMAGDGYRESMPDLRSGAVAKGVLEGLAYVGTPAMLEYRVEGNNAWHPLSLEVHRYNEPTRYIVGDVAGFGDHAVGSRRLLQSSQGSDGLCWVDGDSCVAEGICYEMLGSCSAIGATARADIDECELGLDACHSNATCINLQGFYRCECVAGFYGTGVGRTGSGTHCVECPAGKYSHAGATVCTNCPSYPLGTSRRGSTSVISCLCRPGYFGNLSDVNGTCEECPVNSYCPGGVDMLSCPANSSSPRLRSVVTDCICDEGFYGANGEACTMCPPGSECIGGWFKETCESGTYAAAYSTSCLQCQHNSSSSVGSGFCRCDFGYKTVGSRRMLTNGTCYLGGCAPVRSQADCTIAGVALGLGGGNLAAISVLSNATGAAGCVWNGNSSVLEWVNTSGICTPDQPCVCDQCADRQCEACPDGAYSAAGATSCTSCPLNSYSYFPAQNLTDCVCASAFYLDEASGLCAACPPYSTSAVGSTSSSECACDKGYSGDTDVSNVQCSTSTYSGDACNLPFTFGGQTYSTCTDAVYPGFVNSTINTIRPAQSYQRAWCAIATPPVSRAAEEALAQDWYAFCNCTGQCRMCPAGTFKAEVGESPCLACAAGKYSDDAASTCTECPAFKSSPPSSTHASACTCVAGFVENSTTGDCEDVDECQLNSPCSAYATCNNTFGSFTCSCLAGYHGNGSVCDACEAGFACAGGLAPPQMCANGTYARATSASCLPCPGNSTSGNASEFCRCVAGYVGDGDTSDKRLLRLQNSTCTNENECDTNSSDCDLAAICTDTVGSFTCTCNDGFPDVPGYPPGTNCLSICGDNVTGGNEECDIGPALIGEGCANCVQLAGWTCSKSSTEKSVCQNLDECALGPPWHNCHSNATCSDTRGSFVCTCDSDWFGTGTECASCVPNSESPSNSSTESDCRCSSGFESQAVNLTNASGSPYPYSFTCVDRDECLDGSHSCGSGMMCNNTYGSFSCFCLSNFVSVDDGNGTFTCEDRDECADGSNDCDERATCNNTVGSFFCQCERGYADDSLNTTGVNGSCQVCPSATYSDVSGATSCLSCPGNASSMPGSTSRANCSCNAGFAGSINGFGGECAICDAGFFSGPGQAECCECVQGATSLPGSVLATDCFCDEGFYGVFPVSHTANETCDSGGLVCDACPHKASSPKGSPDKANCSCIPGYYYEGPGGMENATEGNCTKCGECIPGHARVGCSGASAGYCDDINECSTSPGLTPVDGANDCDANARCINLNTSYACFCGEDFFGNGSLCMYVVPLYASRVIQL